MESVQKGIAWLMSFMFDNYKVPSVCLIAVHLPCKKESELTMVDVLQRAPLGLDQFGNFSKTHWCGGKSNRARQNHCLTFKHEDDVLLKEGAKYLQISTAFNPAFRLAM